MQPMNVEIILARMDSHPEEFYNGNEKWRFIFSDFYRDVMTETEKGMIFDKLKQLRREEFSQRVLQTLVPPEEETEEEAYYHKGKLRIQSVQPTRGAMRSGSKV
jgi:hypothetical protein